MKINVNDKPGLFMPALHFSQGDIGREFNVEIVSSDGFSIPVGASVTCVGTKPSGFGFSVPCTFTDNLVTFTSSDTEGENFTDEAGRFQAEIHIEASGDIIGTANFWFEGERNPHPDGTIDGEAEQIIPELTLLVERVEKASSDILDVQVVATTLPAGSDATYSYDEETNTATFGIPQGESGGGGATGVVADGYDATKTYSIGDYVIHNDVLYKCTTAIPTAESWTAGHWTSVALANDVNAIKKYAEEFETEITSELVLLESNNLIKNDAEMTSGYVAQNGQVWASGNYFYTPKIPVSEGDVVRIYTTSGGSFALRSMRFLCAYDSSGSAVSASGGEYLSSYTVPSGIASVVISTNTGTDVMVTKNYVASQYEAYFDPYYVASYDFIDTALNSYNVPSAPVVGYDISRAYEYGIGYYEVSGGVPRFYNYSSYRYAVMSVNPNSIYCWNKTPVAWILTDDSGSVVKYKNMGQVGPDLYVETGNATKLYYTITASYWDETVIAEGINSLQKLVEKPSFISGITQRMNENRYACALPKKAPYFTVGMPQKWYYDNMCSIPTNIVTFYIANWATLEEDGRTIDAPGEYSPTNGYGYWIYDQNYAKIDEHIKSYLYSKNDNLQSCSALVIGDSTVAQNIMTQKMLDAFTSRSKTLTLLGTKGTAPNKHEGRSGWSAKDYCTQASRDGVANPFYNDGFDFSYYMTSQGYSAPDFVVVQLGINDLYGADFGTFEATKIETAGYVKEIIESILSYNSSQKILLNLPTAVNSDASKHTEYMQLVRNKFICYNEYMLLTATKYGTVRCSNCHLILDPTNDILDDVHPKTAGYEKMANEVVSQINCWQQA